MSPNDFDDISRLWQQEQSPEEKRIFDRLARRTGWRAKALQYGEFALAAVVAVVIAVFLVGSAAPSTWAIALLLLTALIWSGWRRHALYKEALNGDSGGREALLDTAIAHVRVRLQRSLIGLALLAPGFLLGLLLPFSVMTGGELRSFAASFFASLTSLGWAFTALVALLVMMLFYLRVHYQLRSELRNLTELRAQYRAETELDAEQMQDEVQDELPIGNSSVPSRDYPK